jgi:anti-anti-sigma factor
VEPFGNFVSHFYEFRFPGEEVVLVECTRANLSDEENVEAAGHELLTLIDKYGCRRIVLDMSRVEYVTSPMIGQVIRAHRQMHRDGGRFVLCGITPTVQSILDTSRLTDYFSIGATEADALRLVSEDPPPTTDHADEGGGE